MQITTLQQLLKYLSLNDNYKKAIVEATQKYNLKLYKIFEFTPQKVAELYDNLQKKFYHLRKKNKEQCWYQNQLRIFIWLLVGYGYLHKKSIEDLKTQDWEFFSSIFNYRHPNFYQYQGVSLLRINKKSPPWTIQEIQMLQKIICHQSQKNKWNSVARELFLQSNKKYYRNAKQCRERWINHLDPIKIKTEWTLEEDLVLLNCIKKVGKKWSVAVRQLLHTRNQHTVKNRYKSLIAIQSKKYPEKLEQQIEEYLIKKMQFELSQNNNKSQKQEIFVCQNNQKDYMQNEVKEEGEDKKIQDLFVNQKEKNIEQFIKNELQMNFQVSFEQNSHFLLNENNDCHTSFFNSNKHYYNIFNHQNYEASNNILTSNHLNSVSDSEFCEK